MALPSVDQLAPKGAKTKTVFRGDLAGDGRGVALVEVRREESPPGSVWSEGLVGGYMAQKHSDGWKRAWQRTETYSQGAGRFKWKVMTLAGARYAVARSEHEVGDRKHMRTDVVQLTAWDGAQLRASFDRWLPDEQLQWLARRGVLKPLEEKPLKSAP